jgi:hypothetical protein
MKSTSRTAAADWGAAGAAWGAAAAGEAAGDAAGEAPGDGTGDAPPTGDAAAAGDAAGWACGGGAVGTTFGAAVGPGVGAAGADEQALRSAAPDPTAAIWRKCRREIDMVVALLGWNPKLWPATALAQPDPPGGQTGPERPNTRMLTSGTLRS